MPRPLKYPERLDVKLQAGTVAALIRAAPGQPPSVTARELLMAALAMVPELAKKKGSK